MYSSDAVNACRQVLNDVIQCLRAYENRYYLIGGWAVYHLLDRPDRTPEVIGFAGTEDVDLAFLVPILEHSEMTYASLRSGNPEASGSYHASSPQRNRVLSLVIIETCRGGRCGVIAATSQPLVEVRSLSSTPLTVRRSFAGRHN